MDYVYLANQLNQSLIANIFYMRSNNKMLLKPMVVKTLPTLGDQGFACAAPRLWNPGHFPLQPLCPRGRSDQFSSREKSVARARQES